MLLLILLRIGWGTTKRGVIRRPFCPFCIVHPFHSGILKDRSFFGGDVILLTTFFPTDLKMVGIVIVGDLEDRGKIGIGNVIVTVVASIVTVRHTFIVIGWWYWW